MANTSLKIGPSRADYPPSLEEGWELETGPGRGDVSRVPSGRQGVDTVVWGHRGRYINQVDVGMRSPSRERERCEGDLRHADL